jgi:hypothetical protein
MLVSFVHPVLWSRVLDCCKFADVCFGGDWTPYCASIFKVWSSDRLVGRDQSFFLFSPFFRRDCLEKIQ